MKLKTKLKAVLAAVSFAFAGAAVADINPGSLTTGGPANPQYGNGELFLSVWNGSVNGGTSYTRDLGINLSNFLPGGAVAPVDSGAVDFPWNPISAPAIGAGNVLTPGYQLIWGADPTAPGSTLATLLATAGTNWSIIAGDNLGVKQLLFTSNAPLPEATDTPLSTAASKIVTHITQVNNILEQAGAADNANNYSSIALSPSVAYSGGSAFGSNIGSSLPFSTSALVGAAMNFWYDATGASVTPFAGGQWLLATDGTLSWNVAAAPVPEPGTWAMLLAGLGMLFGIARRRTA